MADKFKKGDVVILKSGGPPMTVDELPSKLNDRTGNPFGFYETVWFKGATKLTGRFEEHLIKEFTPPSTAGSAPKILAKKP